MSNTLQRDRIRSGWRHKAWLLAAAVLACAVVLSIVQAASAQQQQAWEFDQYRVKAWLALEPSAALLATADTLLSDVKQSTVSLDPTAWSVEVTPAPRPWDHRLRQGLQWEADTEQLATHADVGAVDKLMLVAVWQENGQFQIAARELDLRTRVWGAIITAQVHQLDLLPSAITGCISRAFMPLARIERVTDKGVRVRVRAAGLCERAEVDDQGTWQVVINYDSPAWVRADDVLLPVIRRVDRLGEVESIQPVERTFLSVVDHQRTLLSCTTHSMHRAPLGGRTGSRIEKLALVIRAPDRPTQLKLVARDEPDRPLPGLEIWSRSPFLAPDDPSELLGKTDWRGMLTIPPADETLRVLYVKSGERALARIPMVPGLYDQLLAEMPNDEKRLYAEGVVRGLQNELTDLVARRQVLATEIDRLVSTGQVREAREVLATLRDMPDSIQFNAQLVNEEKKIQSSDSNEMRKITAMFDELRLMSSQHLSSALVAALSGKINDALAPDVTQRDGN